MHVRTALVGLFLCLSISSTNANAVEVRTANEDKGPTIEAKARWIYVSRLSLANGAIDITPESQAGTKWHWYRAKDGTFKDSEVIKTDGLEEFTPSRQFWPDDDSNQIVVGYLEYQKFPCKNEVKVDFNETARKSAVAEGIAFFLAGNKNPAPSKTLAAQVAASEGICVYARAYTLQEARATLAITVTPPSEDTVETGADQSKPTTIKATILTGSKERWFFTTDIITTSMSQVTFDSTNHTFQEKSTPNNLNFGINYLFTGDVYDSEAPLTSGGRFGIKLFASSVHPKQLYGLGFGYLIPGNLFDSSSTGSVMIFVAYVASKGNTGPTLTRARLGLSFNLGSFSSGK